MPAGTPAVERDDGNVVEYDNDSEYDEDEGTGNDADDDDCSVVDEVDEEGPVANLITIVPEDLVVDGSEAAAASPAPSVTLIVLSP